MSEPTPQGLFQQAVAAHQAGAAEEAERLYRAVLLADPQARAARGNLATLSFHRGDYAQAVEWLGQLLALDSRQPAVLNNRASALARLGRVDDAVADCAAALAIDPAHAAAADTLASLLGSQGRYREAVEARERVLALTADAADAKALAMRGRALVGLGRPQEGLACLTQAADRAPDQADAHFGLAGAFWALKRVDDALAAYDRALALDPGLADAADWNRAHLLLAAGRADEGWTLFERRWRDQLLIGQEFVSDAPALPEGADLAGRTVLVHHEQGLGDTLQMLRYLPMLRRAGARVLLTAPRPLEPLYGPLADQVLEPGAAVPPHDFRVMAMSLPLALGARSGAPPPPPPYLTAPPPAVRRWARRLNAALGPRRRLRVGLAWAGNPAHGNDHNRSLPLAELEPLLGADADFVSLQVRYDDADRAVLEGEPRLRDLAAKLTDFGETAGLVRNLDLVIAVDTSVAHLAGALGGPLWLLLPWGADWRWGLEGETTPWYPQARLLRQPEPGDWASVVKKARGALDALLKSS